MAVQPGTFFHRRYAPMWVLLVLGLGLTGLFVWELDREAVKLDEDRFKLQTGLLAAMLESNMERYEERLARLADHCAAFDELPNEIWYFRRGTTTDLNGNLPAVLHALYCVKVPAREFQTHAERGKEVFGTNGYPFMTELRRGRSMALPVWQFWNRAGYKPYSRGEDMALETERHPSLLDALRTGAGWVSPQPGKTEKTDGSHENGFWFVLTLFRPDQRDAPYLRPGETPDAFARRIHAFRRNVSSGVLAVFISTDRLVDRANDLAGTASQIHLRLYASADPRPDTILNPVSAAPRNRGYQRTINQQWYGRKWTLEMTATPGFYDQSLRYRSWLVSLGGGGMSLLGAALVGVAIRSRARQERFTLQIREARDALAGVQQERERLNRDLHDSIVQSLYAIQLGLGHMDRLLVGEHSGARHELATVRGEIESVMAEVRRVITDSRGKAHAVDLASVLQKLASTARRGTAAEVRFDCDEGAAARIDGVKAVQLANIAREAISNSLRHGQPQQLNISLRSERAAVTLTVEDNGSGFELTQPAREGALGLKSMQARAREIGATWELESTPGKGTRIRVSVAVSLLDKEDLISLPEVDK